MLVIDNFHIVLVRPQDNLNIGSVARAMTNLGFSNLHLVAPKDFQVKRALITACHGTKVIEELKVHSSLEEALSGMQEVVGFSARTGRNRDRPISLPSWVEQACLGGAEVKTALMFGSENNGLSSEELSYCRKQILIPCAPTYTSFNLAQAVLLALYEIFRRSGEETKEDEEVSLLASQSEQDLGSELASWDDFEQLDRLVDQVLTRSRFYKPGTPAPIPLIVKRLLRNIRPDQREMGILIGMFGKIDRALSGEIPPADI